MYLGFIVTESQYRRCLKGNQSVKLFWLKESFSLKPKCREELYFCLSSDNLLFIIVQNIEHIREMIDAGVVYDLTECEELNLVEFATNLKYSEHECIRACNELRESICEVIDQYRVCGPEYECLLNEKVYSKASEMVGLMKSGMYIGFDGSVETKVFYECIDKVRDEYEFVERNFDDLGQRKLYTMFSGFVLNRRIIYVGSAPGEAWISYALRQGYEVVSLDPRDLYNHYGKENNLERLERNKIRHIKEPFLTWDNHVLKPFLDKPFDLIWDVRGDYENDTQYELMVEKEVSLLNEVVSTMPPTCVRACFKIRLRNIEQYKLPTGGRFFLMPWCLSRKKYELRYVVRFVDNVKISRVSVACENNLKRLKEGYWGEIPLKGDLSSDFNLFCASKMMRMDVMNYMDVVSVSKIEFNLFTLNCNPSSSIRAYLDEAFGVISFFTKRRLNDNESIVPYDKNILRFAVVDSRVFIGKYIADLILLVPMDLSIFKDELLTSFNFRLKSIGHGVHKEYGIVKYHAAKRQSAMMMGKAFRRFPEAFSVNEKLVTPSGHAMRMMIHEIKKNDYSIFSFFQKVLYNFYANTRVKNKKAAITRLTGKVAALQLPRLKSRSFEKSSSAIWHSIDEWKAGFKAGELLLKENHDISDIFDNMIMRYTSILGVYEGMEIRHFNKMMNLPIVEIRIDSLSTRLVVALTMVEKVGVLLTYIGENLADPNGLFNFSEGLDLLAKRSKIGNFLIREMECDYIVRKLWYRKLTLKVLADGKYENHYSHCFNYDELIRRAAMRFLCKRSEEYSILREQLNSISVISGINVYALIEREYSPSELDEAIYAEMVKEWLDSQIEIFRPRLYTRWISRVPEVMKDIVISRFTKLFHAEDLFVLERVRELIKQDDRLTGLEAP
uniref:Uncharacterized protein n=1 Tax=Hubei odonate virus 15 TaxID=1922996 RepID=A0A1L3KPB3_9VIRU|nr:hypothetical protein 1 [Hubei odonate virus 15]